MVTTQLFRGLLSLKVVLCADYVHLPVCLSVCH